VPIDTAVRRPGQYGIAGQLRAVVAADRFGLAVTGDEKIKPARHPLAREREIGERGQALAGADVVDRQVAEAAARSDESPQVSVWKMNLFGGVELTGDPRSPSMVASVIGTLTGPIPILLPGRFEAAYRGMVGSQEYRDRMA